MNIDQIQSTKKLIQKKEHSQIGIVDYKINTFVKDAMAISSSSIVRRLQDKTQVFPLDKNDFIRTRLTHSMEVSAIGKQLGIMINQSEYCKAIAYAPQILECAGLLHDLGNPPFGHFGEIVIKEWFKKELNSNKFTFKGKLIKDIFDGQFILDLLNFNGNAQTFRLLTKVYHNDNGKNLNLSYSIISTLIKYPVSSIEMDSKSNNIALHKLGYFFAERNAMRRIAEEVGTYLDGKYVRHPLAFLLEAADDIAYATSDLEDAFKKKLFTIQEFIDFLKKYDGNAYYTEIVDLIEKIFGQNLDSEFAMFHEWILEMKWRLMYTTSFSFTKNISSIMKGEFEDDLFSGTVHEQTLKMLKQAAVEFAFNNKSVLKLEIAGKTILENLLQQFVYAVIHWDTDEKLSKTDLRLVSLISKDFKNDYLKSKGLNENYNLYLRFLMVIDFISSMTDSHAKNLYRELNGLEE